MKPYRGSNKLGIASKLNPWFTKKEQNEKEWSINKWKQQRIKEENKNWEGEKGDGTLTLVELGSSWGGRGERNRSQKKEKDALFVCVVPTNSVYWELRQRRKWREEKEVERGKRKTRRRGKEREDEQDEDVGLSLELERIVAQEDQEMGPHQEETKLVDLGTSSGKR